MDTSQIGLPDDIKTRDDAYIAGIADGRTQALREIEVAASTAAAAMSNEQIAALRALEPSWSLRRFIAEVRER